MAGYTWADVGTKRLPFDQFVAFVHYSPPGTALYHALNQGWTVTDHLVTDLLEVTDWLAWAKTENGRRNRKRPKRRPRPGAKESKLDDDKSAKQMTVAEYVERTGMKINLGEGGETKSQA